MKKFSSICILVLAVISLSVFASGTGDVEELTTSAEATTTEAHQEIFNICGGELTLSPDQDTYISYKLEETLVPKERCIWILRPPVEPEGRSYSVKVTMLAHGFRSDGVALYTVDPERNNLSSYWISRIGEEVEIFLHPLTFLNFFADTTFPYSAKGFWARVRLEEIHRDEVALVPLPQFSIFMQTAWHNYFRHPKVIPANYEVNERVYVIIAPENSQQAYFRLNVDYMDISNCTSTCDCDFLDVRRINGVNGYSNEHRICGTVEAGQENIVTSRSPDPILLIFNSDETSVATGFQVTWEQSNL